MKKARERLSKHNNSPARRRRYGLIKLHAKKGDTILDVGCGSAFGRELLSKDYKYIGVDNSELAEPDIIVDANTWQPDFEFDVFCGFESIEHIKNTENYVAMAKKAKKHIFLSCPASETLSFNPYHIYDFSEEDIKNLFEDENWEIKLHITKKVRYGLQQIIHLQRKQ